MGEGNNKQHWLPKVVMRGFCIQGTRNTSYMVSRQGDVREKGFASIGKAHRFYGTPAEERPYFRNLENSWRDLRSRIEGRKLSNGPVEIDLDELADVIHQLVVLSVRNGGMDNRTDLHRLAAVQHSAHHIIKECFSGISYVEDALSLESSWRMIRVASKNGGFVLGDNPVVFPSAGLSGKLHSVGVPISDNTWVFVGSGMEEVDRFLDTPNFVDLLNLIQARQASRFVLAPRMPSSSEVAAWQREIRAENPPLFFDTRSGDAGVEMGVTTLNQVNLGYYLNSGRV